MPRLHILDDIFRGTRVGIPHLDHNLRWLEGFCRVLAGSGWDVKAFGAREDRNCEDRSCDAARLVEVLGHPPTPEGWAAARCAPFEAGYVSGLRSFIAADFVMGFGLPPVLMNMLLDTGTPFLDLEIDAIRFAPDLFPVVSTDDQELAAAFSQLVVTDTATIPALSALLARERRRAPTRGFFPGARAGLFVGQVPHDAAVIADGRFVSPVQVIDRIAEIAAAFDLFLIRPHPHWKPIDHLLPILDAVPHAVLTHQPSYALLADPSVTDVVALSSGLLAEARLAGKRIHQLMAPDRDRPLVREPLLRQVRVSWETLLQVLMRRLRRLPPVVSPDPGPAPMPLHAAIQMNWGLVSAPAPEAPELLPAHELSAGSPAFTGALTHGWHPQESWGAWAAEQEALLLLRLPASDAGRTLRLAFMAAQQGPGGAQMVEVSAGKERAPATARMTATTAWQGSVEVAVSADMVSAGLVQLRIRSANIVSPADLEGSDDARKLGVGVKSVMLMPEEPEVSASLPRRDGRALGPAYYTSLHETNSGYQQNNWLVEEADLLSHIPGETLQEVGCGNGRYLDLAAQTRRRVIGCDWAQSPGVRELQTRLRNVEFVACDITRQIPHFGADILVSADVLEHIAPQDIAQTLARLTRAGRWQFHKIACYDDAHSHLTIRDPAWWLAQFCAVSPSYRLVRAEFRLGDQGRPICIVSNFPFAERGIVVDPLRPGAEQELAARSIALDETRSRAAEAEALLQQANRRTVELEAEVSRLGTEASRLGSEVSRLGTIEWSTIWRATRPIRRVANRLLGR